MIEAKRKEMRRLWEQGVPTAQIAAEVGCAKQSVYHILRHKHTRVELKCIYPALEAWRQRKGLSLSASCSDTVLRMVSKAFLSPFMWSAILPL